MRAPPFHHSRRRSHHDRPQGTRNATPVPFRKRLDTKNRNLTRTANSLASAIRSNDLELIPEEQRALSASYGILERGCSTYGKTAAIAKQKAADRAKRMERAKALVKARFGGLESTADRVAFIAASLSYSFAPDSPAVLGLMEAADKVYSKRAIDHAIARE